MSVDGWETALLGDRVSIRARIGWKGLQAGEYVDQGFIFLATPNIKGDRIDFRNVNYINERRFQESANLALEVGDVLLVKDGSTLGISNIVRRLPSPTTINGSIALLRCGAGLHPPFLHQLTKGQAFQKLVQDKKSGLGVPHLFQADLREFRVPSPPLPEQRRIAEILDTLDEAIRKTEQVIAKLQQMKQGLLHDLLTRGIDEHGELRDPERHPEQFEDSPLGRIPGGWEVVPIVAYGSGGPSSVVNGPFGSDLLTSELRAKGVPVIYIRDVRENRYRRVSVVHVTPKKARSLSFCDVRRGDVLVAKVGTPPCIAAPYLLESGAIVTQDVIRVRVEVDSDAVFLSGLLNSSLGRAAIRKISVGGTRERVSLTDFKRVRLPKPQDDERREIGNRIASLLEQEDCLHAEDQKLRTLKQGLMDDLLTGRVRVSAPTEATP
jgi:type I restriction enzyme S subunit